VWGLGLVSLAPWRKVAWPDRFLACIGMPMLLFFGALTLSRSVRGHWILPGAATLFLLVAASVVRGGKAGKWLIGGAYVGLQAAKGFVKDVLTLSNPLERYREKKRVRGMSMYHDWIDWVGGYPFETAKPEEIFDFYRTRGFLLDRLTTCGSGQGCNEFVFRRTV